MSIAAEWDPRPDKPDATRTHGHGRPGDSANEEAIRQWRSATRFAQRARRPRTGAAGATDTATLDAIANRILWLAVRMIHEANHVRPSTDGLKVGGHQASSASVVSILTALYFRWLRRGRPRRDQAARLARPTTRSQYLLGNLDARYLTRLREFGGLQSYPRRTKDPDPVDFSTGSVGLGAVAPLFAALADRYLRLHFRRDRSRRQPERRFVALVGDAELDEGNVWEADPRGRAWASSATSR